MFSWLKGCWGESANSSFEQARRNCSYADWVIPSNIDIGSDNPQIEREEAIKQFFHHLEQDEERTNAAFVLKHLLILDLAIEERCQLQKISQYTNNQLLCNRSKMLEGLAKELIGAYYLYLKKKAKTYLEQAPQLSDQKVRENFLSFQTIQSLMTEINRCFKLQAQVIEVSNKYKSGNKEIELIQLIFSCLLKTYLFCYSTVSLGIRLLFQHLQEMSSHSLTQFEKLVKFYNHKYSKDFFMFIDQNKEIEVFRNFNYKEIIFFQSEALQILDYQQQFNKHPSDSFVRVENFPSGKNLIVKLNKNLEIQMKRDKRKEFDLEGSKIKSEKLEHLFREYQNFYSEQFLINEPKMQNQAQPKKGKLNVQKKESLYTGIVDQRTIMSPLISYQKFNQEEWDSWKNIYSA